MTDLSRKVVRRVRREGLVVTLAPEGLYIREAGRRTVYGPTLVSKAALRRRAHVRGSAAPREARRAQGASGGTLTLAIEDRAMNESSMTYYVLHQWGVFIALVPDDKTLARKLAKVASLRNPHR